MNILVRVCNFGKHGHMVVSTALLPHSKKVLEPLGSFCVEFTPVCIGSLWEVMHLVGAGKLVILHYL